MTLKELRTLIPQIECKINNRPLTYVSGDLENLTELTPAHLLYGYRLDSVPESVDTAEAYDPSYNSREFLDRLSKNLSFKLESFWSRWRKEYLTSLRERHINRIRGSENKIGVGDVVLIHDDCLPRLRWKLGLVSELFRGADGLVRSVRLRTKNGETNRPITKLYPLEVASEMDEYTNVPSCTSSNRPSREAAIEARSKIRRCL